MAKDCTSAGGGNNNNGGGGGGGGGKGKGGGGFKGDCNFCGKPGHMSRNCFSKDANVGAFFGLYGNI